MTIYAACEDKLVFVAVPDTRGGVPRPKQLFQPFQAADESTGLGHYFFRAFLRCFKGELRYRTIYGGACIIVELLPAVPSGQELQCMQSAF